MTALEDLDTEQLLLRAGRNDHSARDQLFTRHRGQLRRMVRARMDDRLAVRIDPSDVVQGVLAEAAQGLPDYLQDRPLPFYLWLRELAWKRLVDLRRRHIEAQKRSVTREEAWRSMLSEHSANDLAGRLISNEPSASRRLIREELLDRVRAALDVLPDADREVLVLRYLEQLTVRQVAAVLGTTEGAVSMRQLRAVERIRKLLDDDLSSEGE